MEGFRWSVGWVSLRAGVAVVLHAVEQAAGGFLSDTHSIVCLVVGAVVERSEARPRAARQVAQIRHADPLPVLPEQEIEQWRDTDDEWEEQFEDHYGVAVSDASGPMHASVDWVIVGGESGPGARPMHPQWARDLRDQCVAAGVPFFMKQLSGERGKTIKDISTFPLDLQVRKFPQ